MALRIYPTSHTNPVFVLVDGKPIRASKKSAQWCLQECRSVLVAEARAIKALEREAAAAAYDKARDAYKAILAEAVED